MKPNFSYPHERKLIGRWIGVAEDWIDMAILVCKSVWAISDKEMAQIPAKEQMVKLDATFNKVYGHEWPTEPGFEYGDILSPSKYKTHTPAKTEDQEMDEYLTRELLLPRGGYQEY
jgi:hypothetical protein